MIRCCYENNEGTGPGEQRGGTAGKCAQNNKPIIQTIITEESALKTGRYIHRDSPSHTSCPSQTTLDPFPSHTLPACLCFEHAHLSLVLYLLDLPAQLLDVLVKVGTELLDVLLPLAHRFVNRGAQTGDSRTQGLGEYIERK